jgi:hypothetical protein
MIELVKVSEKQEDDLTSLLIALHIRYNKFNEAVLKMRGALYGEGTMADRFGVIEYQEALEHLDNIEDAIKRFRENRKQKFEE